jgi:hypothetical protein
MKKKGVLFAAILFAIRLFVCFIKISRLKIKSQRLFPLKRIHHILLKFRLQASLNL